MRGINKVILIGSLGNDPELRRASNGNAIVNISLATSERWRDKQSGEYQERTEWHRIVFFGRIAEIVNEYARKGSKLYVEGRLQTRKWVTQEGQDRYTTEVVIDVAGTMQLLDSKKDSAGGFAPKSSAPPPPAAQSSSPATAVGEHDFEEDDIPF